MKTVLFRIQVWVYLLAYLTSAYPVRSVPSHPPKQSFSVSHVVSIVVIMQSLSHVWFFVTPGAAAQQAPLFFTVFWSLHKFISIESVVLSNHRILCHPLLLSPSIFLSQHQSRLFTSGGQSIESFSFSISSSSEYSGLISFRIDWFHLQPTRTHIHWILNRTP